MAMTTPQSQTTTFRFDSEVFKQMLEKRDAREGLLGKLAVKASEWLKSVGPQKSSCVI